MGYSLHDSEWRDAAGHDCRLRLSFSSAAARDKVLSLPGIAGKEGMELRAALIGQKPEGLREIALYRDGALQDAPDGSAASQGRSIGAEDGKYWLMMHYTDGRRSAGARGEPTWLALDEHGRADDAAHWKEGDRLVFFSPEELAALNARLEKEKLLSTVKAEFSSVTAAAPHVVRVEAPAAPAARADSKPVKLV